MRPPYRQTFKQWLDTLWDGLSLSHVQYGQVSYLCRWHKQPVEFRPVAISIHDARFEHCTGIGRVIFMGVPYCPACDGQEESPPACLHV